MVGMVVIVVIVIGVSREILVVCVSLFVFLLLFSVSLLCCSLWSLFAHLYHYCRWSLLLSMIVIVVIVTWMSLLISVASVSSCVLFYMLSLSWLSLSLLWSLLSYHGQCCCY